MKPINSTRTPFVVLALTVVLLFGLAAALAVSGPSAQAAPAAVARQFAPARESETAEATETRHAEATETEHPPEATETRHAEATETEHPPEATETRHPEATETEHPPEATETRHPEATETEHPPEATRTTTAGSGVPGSGNRTFPETSKSVRGVFLNYWDGHGGLAQQGLPISSEFAEASDLDRGKSYQVQYFERAVFEYHPENAGTPFEVLLAQLGTYRYQAKYGAAGAPGQQASTANPRLFSETGKTLGGRFRAYWESHGGLAQQGLPISNEFTEASDLDPGKSYTVQYFERAVFEYHPENAGTPFEVLLAQLGTYRYNAKYGDR